jgi:hypothetical protein
MGNKMAHCISWLAGYIYVGNGTLGATDGVYYLDVSKTYTLVGQVPILGADQLVGQVYVKDEIKHYARIRIRRQRLRLISLQPSTANNMAVYIAPVRGTGDSPNCSANTNTTAALTVANTISMDDSTPTPSYDSFERDISKDIAGGSGAAQNEFDVAAGVTSNVGTGGSYTMVAPTCLCVSGINSTTALRGTQTHMVVIDQIVDILDFLGGNTPTNPEGLVAATAQPKEGTWAHRAIANGNAPPCVKRPGRRGEVVFCPSCQRWRAMTRASGISLLLQHVSRERDVAQLSHTG